LILASCLDASTSSGVDLRPYKAELAARRSGDKAKLKKVLKAREEAEARTFAKLVRAAKGIR